MPDLEELQGELGADQDEMDEMVAFRDDFVEFYNQNKGRVQGRLDRYGKALNTVNKSDLEAKFTCDISTDRATAIKKVLDVMHDMVQVVKGIKDKLPVRNI